MTDEHAPTEDRQQAQEQTREQQPPKIRLTPAEADVIFALIDQGIRSAGLRAVTDTAGILLPALDKLRHLTAHPTPATAPTEDP